MVINKLSVLSFSRLYFTWYSKNMYSRNTISCIIISEYAHVFWHLLFSYISLLSRFAIYFLVTLQRTRWMRCMQVRRLKRQNLDTASPKLHLAAVSRWVKRERVFESRQRFRAAPQNVLLSCKGSRTVSVSQTFDTTTCSRAAKGENSTKVKAQI